jgi:hypothetical protein
MLIRNFFLPRLTLSSCLIVLGLVGYFGVSSAFAGKQTLVLKLKQPLKSEAVKVRVPGAQNARGERRDLEIQLPLGPANRGMETRQDSAKVEVLSLDLTTRRLGRNSLLVGFTLPGPANVEIVMLDLYGKAMATLVSEPFPKGQHLLPPFPFHESDQNGVRFLALKLNGKIALRKVLPQVK